MGSDSVTINIDAEDGNISIHAPAWGATENTANRRIILNISIHAPAWGATA